MALENLESIVAIVTVSTIPPALVSTAMVYYLPKLRERFNSRKKEATDKKITILHTNSNKTKFINHILSLKSWL